MPLGRIAVIMPAVYDELDCEFLSGIHKAAMDTGYDTLVFAGVSAENDKDYTEGENNIYELVFSADIDGVIVAANRFADMGLKKELFRRLEAMDIPCVAIGESNGAYSEIFSNLRKEMKYSPQSNWCISEAALRTGLSGSHFQRLYKKHFGVSFTEELITFRMDRAKYLLKNTSVSVQRIAEECGYTNAAHFMRQFRSREGMSAGQYRKRDNNE